MTASLRDRYNSE